MTWEEAVSMLVKQNHELNVRMRELEKNQWQKPQIFLIYLLGGAVGQFIGSLLLGR